MSIQKKVAWCLVLVLIVVFGTSMFVSTQQTAGLLKGGFSGAKASLKNAAFDQAHSVFASLEIGTKGSVQQGEMDLFADLLIQLGEIPNVMEIGLSDPKGKINYSNQQEAINKYFEKDVFEATIAGKDKAFEVEEGDSLLLLRPQWMEAQCLDCHAEAKPGDLAGILYARYDLNDFRQEEAKIDAVMVSAQDKGMMNSLVTGVGALLLTFIAVYCLLGTLVIRPLAKFKEMVQEIEKGNLDYRLEIDRADEIGHVAGAMNKMVEKLSDMVHRVSNTSKELMNVSKNIGDSSARVDQSAQLQAKGVEDTSNAVMEIKASVEKVWNGIGNLTMSATESTSSIFEMSSSIEEVAQNSETLAQSAEEINSSITEMASSICQVAENAKILKDSATTTASSVSQMDASIVEVEQNAKVTADITEEVKCDAQLGKSAVDATISGINEIGSAYEITSGVINTLSERTENIGSILSVIDEVTDQTNLLALNAAIIAAQAGEHGKGFAVVADEIRELADRTSSSTRDIAAVIRGVQDETAKAVEAINKVENSIADGKELSLQAGEALSKIVSGVQKAAQRMDHIVRATVEQAQGSKTIKEATVQFSEMLEQSANATQEQNKGAELIMAATQRMKDLTSQVKHSTREQSDSSKVIARSMENINEMIQQIKAACDEQKQETNQIVKAVGEIQHSTDGNLNSTNVLNEAVSNLGQQIEVLKKEIASFKVEENA